MWCSGVLVKKITGTLQTPTPSAVQGSILQSQMNSRQLKKRQPFSHVFLHKPKLRNKHMAREREPEEGVLPSMPLSHIARSSCMGTRVASCRTASHWSYWNTSARPGPWRAARGLRGLWMGESNLSNQDCRGKTNNNKHSHKTNNNNKHSFS